MTTSVAMCTYNGARFIEEQLRSILDQTIPVGEVVVCDDCSTDETISIIKKIAKETTIPIHIYINETNLGCVRNFEKAIRLCQGDIIFLSDQDDVWMANKVEAITQWFDQHPTMNVVFGDAILIDVLGTPIMKSTIPKALRTKVKDIDEPIMLWEDMGFSSLAQMQFRKGFGLELWISQNRATGATMAFRNEFVNKIDIVHNNFYHDGALGIYALLDNSLGFLAQTLICYRQHQEQAIGCSLKFPIVSGWDDARVIHRQDVDYSSFNLEMRMQKRLDFVKQRYLFQHTPITFAHFSAWKIYRYCYGKNWFYFFKFDIYKSIRHTFKLIVKR